MKLPNLNKLCTPAQLYLFIELFLVIIMLVQNGNSDDTLCLGSYECYDAPNKAILLLVKLGYVGFWTFVLNLICNAGYKSLAWFLVLLPAILFLLLLVLLLGPWNYNGGNEGILIEGVENMNECSKTTINDLKTVQKTAWLVQCRTKPNINRIIDYINDILKKTNNKNFNKHFNRDNLRDILGRTNTLNNHFTRLCDSIQNKK